MGELMTKTSVLCLIFFFFFSFWGLYIYFIGILRSVHWILELGHFEMTTENKKINSQMECEKFVFIFSLLLSNRKTSRNKFEV